MGAYGDITCDYCQEPYYELDEHECDHRNLRREIERLRAILEDSDHGYWCPINYTNEGDLRPCNCHKSKLGGE